MVDLNLMINKLVEQVILYLPKVVSAILVLIFGLMAIGSLTRFVDKAMRKSKVDISLRGFLRNLFKISLKVILFITVIAMFGIQMTSFITLLGAAGLAVGLALQGSLANFAGGVLILLFKPFEVGHYIKAQGYSGTVDQIRIFNTILKTPDNKTIIIPNGPLSNGSLINYSVENKRRVDFSFGVGYDDDLQKAQKILKKIVKGHKKVLQDPEPFVRIGELGDSSVNFTVRVWTKLSDYWDVHFDIIETVKSEFDKNKISIPYPQMDIHMSK